MLRIIGHVVCGGALHCKVDGAVNYKRQHTLQLGEGRAEFSQALSVDLAVWGGLEEYKPVCGLCQCLHQGEKEPLRTRGLRDEPVRT